MPGTKIIVILILVLLCGILVGFGLSALVSPPPRPLSIIHTADAPQPIGPYSQAVASDGFVFTSGQIGLDPSTGNLTGTTGNQTVQAMENLRQVLAAGGLDFSDVVQTHIFLTDLGDWETVNGIYAGYFNQTPPARSVVEVKGLPRGAKIEIEMIAQRP